MSVSTFRFLLFVTVAVALYFIAPKKLRWTVLLAAGTAFYLLSDWRCFIFLVVTAVSIFFAAIGEEKIVSARTLALESAAKEDKKAIRKAFKSRQRRLLAVILVLNFAILAVMKYSGVFVGLTGVRPPPFISDPEGMRLLMPLGISFYTFQAAGYLIDVYNGKTAAQHNFGKFFLFVSFFPQTIQGPISRFDQLSPQLLEPHSFDYDRFKSGLELLLWGYFKKLVIADRLFPVIMKITGEYQRFPGIFLLGAMLFYSAQLYADFSGGIDISKGICEILGIELTPNFRQPYFSRSLSEFWRRWHITLGSWFRDYVFYPLATSKVFVSLGKRLRNKVSRTAQERICTSLVSLITFLLIGIWHGATWSYVLYGLWHGGIIALSTMTADISEKALERLHINSQSLGWRIFQTLRTYILVVLGFYMVLAPSLSELIPMLVRSVSDVLPTAYIAKGILLQMRFSRDLPVAVIGIAVMIVVSALTASGRDVRKDLNRCPMAVQWVVLMAGLLAVVVLGCYGPGYDATSFIYQVF